VGELREGQIREYEIHPEDFGLAMSSSRSLRVDTPEASREMLLSVLDNQPGPARDIVVLNAGLALYAANVSATVVEGMERARQVLDNGQARQRLERLVALTQQLAKAA